MKRNKEIFDQFNVFEELMREKKIIREEKIFLHPKKSNVVWLWGESVVSHETIEESVTIFVQRSKRDGKYGVQLRCQSLTKEPFFRFDSDGPAHRNDDPNIPLEQQQVTTPHFNTFDSEGRHIAYKNEALMNEGNVIEITKDINFGLALFCDESRSCANDGKYPSVFDQAPELTLVSDQEFNFDTVKFEK